MNIIALLFGKMGTGETAPVPVRARLDASAPGNSVPDLTAAMADYSGYTRQGAIARAVTLRHVELLPSIAARLNDWVPQVRDAARAALITLLPTTAPQAMLALAPAIVHLRKAGRHDHTAWVNTFERALIAQLTPKVLLEGIGSTDAKVARACFQIMHRHAPSDAAHLIAAAFASRSDIVMMYEAAAMISLLPAETRPALYQAMLRSAFGAVRAIGLSAVLGGPASAVKRETALAHL